ncbi:glycoside hydrolase family protein [Synechococcus elongatus]|uniref:Lysozyme n=2 Tax=Synechococcus elongatus TaxID=32046 RepID=Q31Q81_SYNE7|nr:chain A, D20c mutant of T4 lysozyme [Synechococcus elongatus]ABB56788.1 chain A, D20c mutant of T4 lysozyme [Synechococcus elongatus PCC 7942 = FACHB-805]AJD58672.1 lysozyme [Synechococcus elongatus UTEX 2973]MBD2588654.1 lysozyme [Synechococcus elongatus FACHB-242]MBD2689757.1 lysozyme [Synechococcus elongatus FACHB-1061]MBD2708364.1 lysozyme [Synechococcus elongatus PCC 7942 = FACHB-805]
MSDRIRTIADQLTGERVDLIRQLTLHEGLRLKPYRCTAGRLTIGIGRNLDDRGISEAEARLLLVSDIDHAMRQLESRLPWVRQLSWVRQRVLIDMAINLGIDGLLRFRKTLGHIEAGRYAEAADEMLNSLWADQVGERARRLSRMMGSNQDPFA